MRVISSLADIDFGIGRVARAGGNLVIESSEDSTIATKVTVTPRDALKSIGILLTSPSVWLFVLTLPFAGFAAKGETPGNAWAERRSRTGLNKPW